PTHTYGTAGVFVSSLILTSNLGCRDTATRIALVNSVPLSTITASGALTLCSGDSLLLTAATGGYNYVWSTAATTQSITVKTSGTFSLTISDTLTGCFSTGSATVTVIPSPTVFAGNDTLVDFGKSINLNATGAGIVSWNWSPATDLNNAFIANPTSTPQGTITYKVTGMSINGCTAEDSIMITVIYEYKVAVTNLMTPNGDGYNDKWLIDGIEYHPNTEVIVVNREGQQVFKSESYDNEWDGTRSGNVLPDGTYYYIIKFENDTKIYKGAITILRENSK
ncbi:MAG: gliding motility-associated C-terminal domain-containing protein, partial [Bacteroidetes bacterium]|nr:gliding motility-associated C-terminal domain-containing protein [Bacteroidota bacterium]